MITNRSPEFFLPIDFLSDVEDEILLNVSAAVSGPIKFPRFQTWRVCFRFHARSVGSAQSQWWGDYWFHYLRLLLKNMEICTDHSHIKSIEWRKQILAFYYDIYFVCPFLSNRPPSSVGTHPFLCHQFATNSLWVNFLTMTSKYLSTPPICSNTPSYTSH